ncbi:MAG: hypothetical protein KatS3mg011_1407 [Acidimicrobiia bacterium]|nr:MAG: hypothetical protein KatS3mg011_1407 [Acidimicrobiia bacterium]
MADALILGRRIRHYRRLKGMTLEDLGGLIGRPAPFLSLVENGRRRIRDADLEKVADALGVTTEDLLKEEAPDHRSWLEIEVERIQSHPWFEGSGLPRLRPSARIPDEALELIVGLFSHAAGSGQTPDGLGAEELRRAHGELTRTLQERDGYLAEVEKVATSVVRRADYPGTGPLTSRNLVEIADAFGYRIVPVADVPASVRSIVDHRNHRIYVAQRNELRTRQARKAVLQTIGAIALSHRPPRSVAELLTQRLETAYFAAAVLVPETPAVAFLEQARRARDLSVEDVKEQFYVSYEMAAQRLTNLLTWHFGVECHFLRSDEEGFVWKGYANDGFPLPDDGFGNPVGSRLCRFLGARTAYRSEDKFDIHYQFTDTPAGSFWCSTHLAADQSGHAFTFGVRFEDARVFRGRNTPRQLRSDCPDGACCGRPRDPDRWMGRVDVHSRVQQRLVTMLSPGLAPGASARRAGGVL